MRHLLPIVSNSSLPSAPGKVINKVNSDHDFYLPFRQHAPSLANARREIYADKERLAHDNSIGFFNILAFRGVFFGSPFARSDHFRWFESLDDWTNFHDANKAVVKSVGPNETEYYVKRNCYGRTQKERSIDLLSKYWEQRTRWNDLFHKPTMPSVKEVYEWLSRSLTKGHTTQFRNIGSLTAFLICGDLVEAGILSMPSSNEIGQLISSINKGAVAGMQLFDLVAEGAPSEEILQAFISLDAALERELLMEEKRDMGYNVIMLEHALCKMNRLIMRGIKLEELLSEI